MALYRYVRETGLLQKKFLTYLSYTFLTGGSLFLFWSFYPIISFQIYSHLFINRKEASPVPSSPVTSALSYAQSVPHPEKIFSTNLSAYTRAGIWFPTVDANSKKDKKLKLKTYTLTVPKLNIKSAKVIVGGENLKKGLIHYLPRTEPGEFGNIAIFGHSTLPQLSKQNNDYQSIFTYLASLDKGDEVFIDVNDLRYAYEVYDTFIVSPNEVSVLDQQYDNAYLTLVTCTPPGTYYERLIVKARIKEL